MNGRGALVETEYTTERGTFFRVEFVGPGYATVDLVTATEDSEKVMYLTTRAYKGIYHLFDIEDYPMEKAFEDIANTKLQTPLEMVHMTWLLRNVSRAFTHQIVRYRVGTAFVQESMRFLGMKDCFRVLVTHKAADPENIEQYVHASVKSIATYVDLLEDGVPSEDARGVLPTNILTNLFFDCSLRTLQGIFPQRLCCQAQQGEWQPILLEMRKKIREYMGDRIADLLRAPYELGKPCGYRASFDRPCIWQKEN